MKIINLTKNRTTYTSNAYFLRGEWNRLSDVNTVIDPGRDRIFFQEIENIYTGVGKKSIEKVLITHNHYDHTSNLKYIIEKWKPPVYAISKSVTGVTHFIQNEDMIKVADTYAIAISCPGHSSDSVCFYIPSEKVLFSGDNNFINLNEAYYQPNFCKCLEKIADLDIEIIYPGHGVPITDNCNKKIRTSLKNVKHTTYNKVEIKRDCGKDSNFHWFNIGVSGERVGKLRSIINDNLIIIFSINIFSEYERRGYAKNTIDIFKNKYSQIIADRVRPNAIDFWRKMDFNEYTNGSFIWKRSMNDT